MKCSFSLLARPLLVVLLLALGGCAANRGPLKAYEGPQLPAGQVALLDVPEQIQVLAIDGREPPANFMTSKLQLALLPGEHVLVLRYVQLFQITSDDHEVVRSSQAALRFTAAAGGQYRLQVPAQRDLQAARQFAKAPQFQLADLAGGAAVESVLIKSYAQASLLDSINKAFEPAAGAGNPVNNTDLLKDIWSRSSRDEREAFRLWINEQPKQVP